MSMALRPIGEKSKANQHFKSKPAFRRTLSKDRSYNPEEQSKDQSEKALHISKPYQSQDSKLKDLRVQTKRQEPYQSILKRKKQPKRSKYSLLPSNAEVLYIDDEMYSKSKQELEEPITPLNLPYVLQSQPNTQRSKVVSRGNKSLFVEKTERSERRITFQVITNKDKTDKMSDDCKVKSKRVNGGSKKNDKTLKESPKLKDQKQKQEKLQGDDMKKVDEEIGGFHMVAAIDFGTTNSGYAFSTASEYTLNPTSITAKLWSSPHFNSVKTSSAILFDPERRFHSFGFNAEEKYLKLLEDDESDTDEWFYFTGFKMILYQNLNINNSTKLKDINGKHMSAMKVFSSAIGYLKADLLGMCQEKHAGIGLDKIRWVITVPALWNDKAKTFMREASRKAGIPSSSLIMALEPEAASLYCIEWMKKSDITDLGRREKFLVLDAGGGTVDIAVHQIQENGRIRELHKANGGDWGGIKVDQEFKKLLKDIVGKEVLEELEKYHTSEYFDVLHSFERAKRRDFSIVGHGKIQITCPSVVNQLCINIRHRDINHLVVENERLKGNVRMVKDKLEIDLALFKSLFSGALRDVLNHLSSLLKLSQVRDVTTFFLVGGYSECYLLQEAITHKFNNLRVLAPPDAVLAVLKGAVLYGHSPRTFQSRISTFTYGIETTEPFERGHPSDKKICINGTYHCDKIFCIHVKDGENVTLGKSVSKTYKTIDPNQTHMEFVIYASTQQTPKFTDEKGCFQLGILTVNVSKMVTDKYGVKKIELELIYGGTELEAVATDIATGVTSRQHFNLKRNSDKTT